MKEQPAENLVAFANMIANDPEYAEFFRGLTLQEKAQELVNNQGFTEEDIASLLLNAEQAKAISLEAGGIWAV